MEKEKTEKRVERTGPERDPGTDRDSLLQTDGHMDLQFTFIDRRESKKIDRTIPESDRQSSHFGKVTNLSPVILGMSPP